MSQPGSSALLRVSLVVATFVVLAAIGWGVSVGVDVFLATKKAAEAKAEAARVAVADREAERTAAALQARYEEERAKLEKDLDAAAFEIEEEPVRVGGGVTAPEKVSGGDPAYTEVARRARVQGVVILEATIDREGRVRSTRVLKTLPFGLDEKAREAVSGWRFTPARQDGRPVTVLYTVTVNFRLK